MTSQTLKYTCIQVTAVLALLASLAFFAPKLDGYQDIGVYARIGDTGLTSGAIDSEYPPLTSALFSLLSLATKTGMTFGVAWALFLAVLLVAVSLWMHKTNGVRIGAWAAVGLLASMILLSPELLFSKYDIIIGILLLLTLTMRNTGHFRIAGLCLLLAASFKIVPLFLWPILFLSTPKAHKKDVLIGSLIGAGIGLLLPLLILRPLNVWLNIEHILTYHGGRQIQIESMWSGWHLFFLHLFGKKAEIGYVAMSAQNMSLNGPLVYVAAASVLAGVGYFIWRAQQLKKSVTDQTSPLFLAALFWMLAVTPILSPQYLDWALPVAFTWLFLCLDTKAISEKHGLLLCILLCIAGYGTQWIVPLHYGAFLDQTSFSLNVVHVLRNTALLLLPFMLIKRDTKKKPEPRTPLTHKIRTHLLVIASASFVALLGLSGLLAHLGHPSFSKVTYSFGDSTETQTGTMPLIVDSQENKDVTLSVDLFLGKLYPTVYKVKPDDCINSMEINGIMVEGTDIQFCDYGSGKPIDFSPFLRSGANHLRVVLGDQGGKVGLRLQPDMSDPLVLSSLFLFFFSIIAYSGVLLYIRWRNNKNIVLPLLFVLGVCLRILYVISTPYDVRGHDTDAHIDYIKYVAEHLSIPAAQTGWEYHQAPLYYVITGLWLKAGLWLHVTLQTLLNQIQWFSLLLSIATLGVAWWIALLLFPKKEDKTSAAFFLGILAVFPSLILLASRITNDTLYQFLGFLFIALLVSFWVKPAWKKWYGLCILAGICLLTKVSATSLLPALFLPLLLLRKTPLLKKILHGTLGLLLIILLCGWLFVLRFYLEADTSRMLSLGNQGMNGGLSTENTVENLLTFNPKEVLAHPYNNPWDDNYRRKFFPEYFFRSAFTGEFGFNDHLKDWNIFILFSAMLLLPLIVYGFIRELCTKPLHTFPLWLLTGLLLGASVSYRLRFAYTANQDFRFVVMVIVPLAYYMVIGMKLPEPLRMIARIVATVFIVCCAFFLIGIAFYPS